MEENNDSSLTSTTNEILHNMVKVAPSKIGRVDPNRNLVVFCQIL